MSNDKKTIKEMWANDMTPAFPTHPGEVLKVSWNFSATVG